MPAAINIPIGTKFGKLTVKSFHGSVRTLHGCVRYWTCQCVCGRFITTRQSSLRANTSQSCGCDRWEHNTKHGQARRGKRSPEFEVWNAMIQRCHNPNHPRYGDWGGRGIRVCDEWRSDFMAFYNHVGPRPSSKHTIERKDNDGNYEPGNVRWATRKEQNFNTRRNVLITFEGQTLCLNQWAELKGFNPKTLWSRISVREWSIEKALTTPIDEAHSNRYKGDMPIRDGQ